MKIAFLHYHLKPGGVTTVIRQQVESLAGQAEMLVLTGAAPPEPLSVQTAVISGIGYDTPAQTASGKSNSANQTAEEIIRAIREKWPGGCDLLHVHNPLLAKNCRLLSILSHLQQHGIRLLLQVHDFAEDGRPASYYDAGTPYPENCHYCVINSRDQAILRRAGLVEEGLHPLPNMVNPFNLQPEKTLAETFVLYPIRAIRRKNIGEAVLLSLFFPPPARLAITLPPNSPRDQAPYESWRAFVNAYQLPVVFEAAKHYDFSDLVKSAENLITTSITEGFGFAFLEPWTAGQFLAGRKLPDICIDFENNGLQLEHLYERLNVSLTNFEENRFFERWQACLQKNAGRFGIKMDSQTIRARYRAMTQNCGIDFGLLDEPFQQQVISMMLTDKAVYQEIQKNNPALNHLADISDRSARIAANRAAVLAAYNGTAYQSRLLNIYQRVMDTTVSHRINKTRLASEFLHPETFSLLKWNEEGL